MAQALTQEISERLVVRYKHLQERSWRAPRKIEELEQAEADPNARIIETFDDDHLIAIWPGDRVETKYGDTLTIKSFKEDEYGVIITFVESDKEYSPCRIVRKISRRHYAD